MPMAFSSFDGLDDELDRGAPVDFTYKPPFTFTGRLDRVVVDLALGSEARLNALGATAR